MRRINVVCRCCNIVGRMVTCLGKSGNGQIGKRINQVMQALSELAI